MAEAFLSQNWYRVKQLKPRLRGHVRLYRHRYRGSAWYVLNDLATGKAHRFSPAGYLFVGRLDGESTVDDIWTDVAEELDEEAPSQDEILSLLAQLDAADLIQCDVPPDTAELFERYKKQARALLKQNTMSPMSFRVPLIDPNSFLDRTIAWVRPLISGLGMLLWLAIVLPAVFLAAQHWPELTENLSDRVLATHNLVLIALCYPFVKALHELWHGYVAKAYGAEVREMGIMFLVFFPVPYVDASAAAGFRNKWHRAYVSAAGIIMELFLAAVAMYLWVYLEPGIARAVAYNVMLIAGISTVLVNGNPLLKFDGYYVFTDSIEVPNLMTRSNKYLGHLVDKHIFGVEKNKPFVATRGERRLFLFYSPAAFIYRMFIMVTIALFVATQFFFVGVVLAIWALVMSLGMPIYKGLKHVFTAPALRQKRSRAIGITFGTVAALLLAMMTVPVPLHTDTEGVVWLPDSAEVMVETDGFLDEIAVAAGAEVVMDQELFRLSDPEVTLRVDSLTWKVRELEIELRQQSVDDPLETKISRVKLDEERARLARELERMENLKVVSRLGGTFSPIASIDDLAGRFFRKGELIGYVLPSDSRQVRLVVPQENIDLVRENTRGVELMLASDTRLTGMTEIVREVPAGQYALPSLALADSGGGEFATDPMDPEGKTAINRVFQFDAVLPTGLQQAPFGSRVYVRFEHLPEPLGFQLYRRVRQLFLSHFYA